MENKKIIFSEEALQRLEALGLVLNKIYQRLYKKGYRLRGGTLYTKEELKTNKASKKLHSMKS